MKRYMGVRYQKVDGWWRVYDDFGCMVDAFGAERFAKRFIKTNMVPCQKRIAKMLKKVFGATEVK